MLCGVYICSGGIDREAEALRRLPDHVGGSEIVCGPLAVVGDASVRYADMGGISCIVEGGLYERGELARELGLETPDDAELVARAYARGGTAVLPRLRGRFSIVIWDSLRQQAILTSDLLATKPIFFWRGAGRVLFASELHDLLSLLPSRPRPDAGSFPLWLGGGGCPEGHTLYDGVSRIGPGELIELEKGSLQVRTYWRPRYSGTMAGSRTELAEGLRDVLQGATARRLSPEATGIVLSGGLDSSIVAGFAARANPEGARLRSYSAVFPGAEFDESEKISELTRAVGIKSAPFQIEPQGTVSLALQHTKRWGLPLPGAGGLIESLVAAEAARDGCEVILDGQTGDEVLGFSPFLIADRLSQGRPFAALRLANSWPWFRPNYRQKLRIFRGYGVKGAAPYRLGQFVRARRESETRGPSWMLPAVRSQYVNLDDMWAWKLGGTGPRWWRYLTDSVVRGPHRDLRLDYLRHRAAAAGTTGESPLYDPDVIDYCLRVPPEIAFDSRFDRSLAREAVRGLIPDPIRLQSKKAIFSPFCFDALTGADSAGVERLITAPDAELGAYVDMERVKRLWHEDRPRSTSGSKSLYWGSLVWRLTAVEIWLRYAADPSFIDDMLARSDVPGTSLRSLDAGTFFPLAQA